MAQIKYVGIDSLGLEDFEARKLQETVAHHAARIERLVHREVELVTHLKTHEHEKGSENREYEAHLRVSYPGATVVSDRQHDWNPLTAVQRGLEAIEGQVMHRLGKG